MTIRMLLWTAVAAAGTLAAAPVLAHESEGHEGHCGGAAGATCDCSDHEAACTHAAATAQAAQPVVAKSRGNVQVVELAVTSEGFVPSHVKVKVGRPVEFVVTRKTDRTCAKEIVMADYGVKKNLPLNQPVKVTFTPSKIGEVRYSCAMGMVAGTLTVE